MENYKETIVNIGINHIQNYHLYHTNIMDICCGEGDKLETINDILYTNDCYGLNKTQEMTDYCNNKYLDNPNMEFHKVNINKEKPPINNCGLIIGDFLQNTPSYTLNRKILYTLHKSLHRKGMVILTDHISPDVKYYNEIYSKTGLTNTKPAKRTDKKNRKTFKSIGFRKIDVFFRTPAEIGYLLMK